MILDTLEQAMLSGEFGRAQKAMQILVTLGKIYGAKRMVPVTSVQIAGVSYDNLGEAGLEFLAEMANGGGKSCVQSTLNPAGMDLENWEVLGIDPEFARQQQRVIEAFARMGVTTTCTCTPYLVGNVPHFGEHIAWAESSAVCYANSVLGARTNREGGPSALAAALTGRTPCYVCTRMRTASPGSMLVSRSAGQRCLRCAGASNRTATVLPGRPVPFLQGIPAASLEELKAFSASLATYGGSAMFHIEGLTPEAGTYNLPAETRHIHESSLCNAQAQLSDTTPEEADFVSLGCPHLSIGEIARIAGLLEGRQVVKEFWITTARPTKLLADRLGYTATIQASGAKFAVDTCCVVAPIKGRFHGLVTDSAKACYYAASKHRFKTVSLPFDEVVLAALGGQGDMP
jgi:predicted aconitase